VRVLGLDPGSRRTGYGIVERHGDRLRVLSCGVIRLPDRIPFDRRLGMLFSGVSDLLRRFEPQQAAIEDVHLARNARTALLLGQARGALVAACAQAEVPVVAFAPSVVKQAIVGYGGAEKIQVQWMIARLLGLKQAPQEDAADALAVAVCCLHAQPRWEGM